MASSDNLFDDADTVHVREVALSVDDDLTRRREKLARIILDELYEFVGLLDARGHTLEINRAALDGAGIVLDDIVGTPFWEARWWAVSAESRDEARVLVERAASGEFVRCDVEVFGRASGTETIIVDYSLTPIRDRDGRIRFLLPEGRNITDKKRAEAELARRTEELQQLLDRVRQLDAAKSNFFANVSHELRTPLTLVLGPTEELLHGDDPLTDRQRKSLQVVERNAVALLRQVNALLDLAKIDAGEMQLNFVRLDIAEAVRRAAAQFEELARQRAVTFIVEAPAAMEADVDPGPFERVVVNLLSNAFKFTPDRGRIRCRLEPSRPEHVLLTIQDSGPGIPPDRRVGIFDRFHQEPSSGTSGGTGLGLAIVKQYVELHGGTVSVTDAPGGGALFQVELPINAPATSYVRRDERPPTEHRPVGPIPHASGAEVEIIGRRRARATVMVVEDHDDMRRFIVEALCDEWRVVAAPSVATAVAILDEELPDLIVSDLMMPESSGQDFVAEIRSRPSLSQVPIVILSAVADEEMRLGLLTSSVQDYLTKPFSAHELRARVRNLVSTKQARDALQAELATQTTDLSVLTQQLIAGRRALQASHDALLRSGQRWRAVYDNSVAGIAVLDPDLRVLEANPSLQRMLRRSEAALRSTTLLEVCLPEERDHVVAELDRLPRAGRAGVRTEFRMVRSDGTPVWVEASLAAAPPTVRWGPMVVAVFDDVTERNEAQAALVRAENDLAQVMRATALGELATSIAHEINQPLAAIAANGHACLRWLTGDRRDEGEAIAAVHRIVRDAERASDIISGIRRFLGRTGVRHDPVDLDEVVRDVLVLVGSSARAHGITVDLRPHPALPRLVADRIQIQQIVVNLITNGIEALAGTPRPNAMTITLEAGAADDSVWLSVSDNGPGMTGDVEQLFQPFQTTKPGGMGMGLAISRSLAEAHGGRLAVERTGPDGTTMRLSLPIGEAA